MERAVVMARTLFAHLRFQMVRHGWPLPAGLALIGIALGLRLLGSEPLRARASALEATHSALRDRRDQAPDADELQRRKLAAFYASLPTGAGALETITTIQRAADANGVTLAHGEYRLSRDGSAPMMRYQITLPARSDYPRLRSWLTDVMNAVPSASLDEISLRREDAANDTVEARVRLTLYLRAD